MRLLIVLSVFLVGCQKTRCYECTRTYKPASFYANTPSVKYATQDICGWTEKQKDDYVRENTWVKNGGGSYPAVQQMNCVEK